MFHGETEVKLWEKQYENNNENCKITKETLSFVYSFAVRDHLAHYGMQVCCSTWTEQPGTFLPRNAFDAGKLEPPHMVALEVRNLFFFISGICSGLIGTGKLFMFHILLTVYSRIRNKFFLRSANSVQSAVINASGRD